MIRFKKIKRTSDGKIHLEYEKQNGSSWDEHSMKSVDEPRPSFLHAWDNMVQWVEQFCELPEGDHQVHPYEIKGFSFSYGGDYDVLGVTITAARTLLNFNSPLILNTPHVIEEPYGDGADDSNVMPADCLDDFHKVIKEAYEYLEGKRAQTNLFDEEADESEQETNQPALV